MVNVIEEAKLGVLSTHYDLIVDNSVGIINTLEEVATQPGDPNFFHFAANACNTSAFCDNRNFHNTGGASADRAIALAKAMGEAIERYSAAIYDREDFRVSSARDADFPVIPPEDFALYSDEQLAQADFPWVKFDVDTVQRWTKTTNLSSGETAYAPAAFVWIPYVFDRAIGEAPIGQPISTGLACHQSIEKAQLSGLSEVLERDGFTIFWQAKTTPAQIRVETLPDDSYDMVERFARTGDKVRLFDITTDNGIPCILSVLSSQSPQRPARVFAASCDLDPGVAVAKALEELAHTRRYSQRIRDNLPPIDPANNWQAVQNQHDHLNFAADPQFSDRIETLLGSKERKNFYDIESLSTKNDALDVGVYVERINETGHQAYFATLTSPDVLSLGLHVGRVLVPGYHPLFMGHQIRALGGTRLYNVPQKMGYPALQTGEDNPLPHPYP